MKLEMVISGGQTGADQAGLRAARACGFRTGGTAPKGWETEDGQAPWLADWGLVECQTPGFVARTRINAKNADMSILFGNDGSPGSRLLIGVERRIKSRYDLRPPPLRIKHKGFRPEVLVSWIEQFRPRVINVAGNRESSAPGIGVWVERHLIQAFEMLRDSGYKKYG
jgi:hypothetical protein